SGEYDPNAASPELVGRGFGQVERDLFFGDDDLATPVNRPVIPTSVSRVDHDQERIGYGPGGRKREQANQRGEQALRGKRLRSFDFAGILLSHRLPWRRQAWRLPTLQSLWDGRG